MEFSLSEKTEIYGVEICFPDDVLRIGGMNAGAKVYLPSNFSLRPEHHGSQEFCVSLNSFLCKSFQTNLILCKRID